MEGGMGVLGRTGTNADAIDDLLLLIVLMATQ